MRSVYRFLFAQPSSDDVDKKRLAVLLHRIILVLLLPSPVFVFLRITSVEVPIVVRILNTIVHALVMLGMLWLLRRGQVQLSASLLSAWMFALLAALLLAAGNLGTPAYPWLIVLIIMGSILNGRPGVVIFLVAAILLGTALLIKDSINLGYVANEDLNTWAISLFSFSIVGLFLYFVIRGWEDALREVSISNYLVAAKTKDLNREIRDRREAQDQLQMFYDFSEDLIAVAGQDGFLRMANPAWERTLGYSRDELLSKPTIELVHPDDVEATRAIRKDLFASGTPITWENRYRHKDGHYVWLSWTAFPYEGVSYAIARNVTAARVMEAERIRIETERQSLQFRERFVNSLSHEIGNNIAVIKTKADMIQHYRAQISDEQRDEHLKVISRQVVQLMSLLDDVKLINQIDQGRLRPIPTPLDLDAFCKQMVAEVQAGATGRHEFHYEFDERLRECRIELDARLLRYVLNNLLGNAVKYSPLGGNIDLQVLRDEDHFVITVSDEGIGVQPEDVEKLFEPYWRGTNVVKIKGTGLGLAIARESVELQGGSICVSSIPGEGSTFEVRLPLSLDAATDV